MLGLACLLKAILYSAVESQRDTNYQSKNLTQGQMSFQIEQYVFTSHRILHYSTDELRNQSA